MRYIDGKQRKTVRPATASRLLSSAALLLLASFACAADGQAVNSESSPIPPKGTVTGVYSSGANPPTITIDATFQGSCNGTNYIWAAAISSVSGESCSVSNNNASGSSCTLPISLSPGTYSVTGSVGYGACGGSKTVSISVADSPTLTLSASPSSFTYGSNTTFTGTLSNAYSGPTGTLTLTGNGTTLCTGTVSSATTVCAAGSSLPPGVYTISGSYSGDGNDYAATAITSVTINKAPSSVSVSCSPNPIAYGGGNTTCTATVPSGATGNVTFTANNGSWTTVPLSGNTASAVGWGGGSWAAGTYPVSATYSGDGNYNSASSTTSVTISKAPSSVSVSCSPNPIVYGGGNTTCTATVPSGATGNVTFTANNGAWTTVPLSGNTASATGWGGGSWATGTYPVGATYNGDGNYSASAGSSTITVNPANTVTQVSSSINPSTYGQTVTFTSLINTGGVAPTGTVAFTDSGVTIGSGNISAATATNLAPYSQQIGNPASWGGYCGPFNNMTANTSDLAAPDGSYTATKFVVPNTSGCAGQSSQGALEEISGGLVGGQSYTASIWARGAAGGEQFIFGVDDCNSTGSAILTTTWQRYTYTVASYSNCEPTRGFQFLSWTQNATYYVWGAQTENAASEGPYIQTLGSAQSGSGSVATLGISTLSGGTHSIEAAYSGDSNDTSSTSPAMTQIVNTATPSISLSCSPNPLVYGASNNTTCTTSIGGGATGTISWTADGGEWETTTLSGGSTSATGWAGWAARTHTVGITYSGDGNFSSATTSIPLTISPSPQTISFPAPTSPVTYGVLPITLSASASSGLGVTFSVISGPGSLPSGSNLLTITGTGTVVVAANQAGGGNYLAAAQVTQNVAVNAATPTITLNPSQNPTCPYPCITQYTATITNGPSTGLMTFYDGTTTSIGSGTISGGIASFSTSALTVGTHSITAVWPGNSDYSAATSGALIETITTQVPQISWPTPAPIVYGTALTSAQLNASASAYVATNYSATKTTTSVVGVFTYTPPSGNAPNGGSQTLKAVFAPTDSTDYVSTTATVPLTVNPSPVKLTVATSGATSSYGAPVTFTATITSGPTGTVTFYDSASSIGASTISGTTATLTTSTLTPGAHNITVGWAGNTNYSSVTSVAVAQTVSKAAPTLSVATSGTLSTYGGSVTFTATISNGLTGPVNFYDGGTTQIGIASISGTTATLTTTTLAVGTHSITAGWAGNADYNAVTSGAITQTVSKATPTLSVTTSHTPSTYGGSVTFTATISGGPTGTITFLDGGSSIGTGAISGTTAEFATTSLAVGTHTITASWAGNANYNAVTSIAITQTVNKATPTLSVATSLTPSTYGGSVTFTATISNGLTGEVMFFDSGTSIGTGTLSGVTATFATSALAAGAHTITASWAGNTNYNAVTSSAVTQTVSTAMPTLSFTPVGTLAYGIPPFSVSASSQSTGAITYTVTSGPATVAGATVTIIGVGTVVLSASQAATANYTAATTSTTFTVSSALPTIVSLDHPSGSSGLAVNISGFDFGAANTQNTVTFNGTAAAVLSWNNSSIIAIVPSGATTGPVVVALANGKSSNTNVIFTTNTSSCPY